ncbi:MAG: protein kinase [Anaerolineae bacterium]
MELVTGGSLQYLAQLQRESKPLEFDLALTVVRQIADALHYAHEHNMIHRDVKPENILLKPAGDSYQGMLTDFGLAKLTEGIGFTVTGKPLGTFTYMSPEQCRAEKGIDRRTDIYALGIVLYELTTGHLPFKPKNIMEALRMHTQMPVTPPRTYVSEYPAELEEIVLKCLAKDREQRYASAKALSNALWDYQLTLKEAYSTGAVADSDEQLATDAGADHAHAPSGVVPGDIEAEPPGDAAVEMPAVQSDAEDPATQDEPAVEVVAAAPQEVEQYATEPPPVEAESPAVEMELATDNVPPMEEPALQEVEQYATEPPPADEEAESPVVEMELAQLEGEQDASTDNVPMEEPAPEEMEQYACADEEAEASPVVEMELAQLEGEQDAATDNVPPMEEPAPQEVEQYATEPPPTDEEAEPPVVEMELAQLEEDLEGSTEDSPYADVEQMRTEPPRPPNPPTSVVPVDVEQMTTKSPPPPRRADHQIRAHVSRACRCR